MLLDRVHVIVDTKDTPACARWFGRWQDPDRGHVAAGVTPPATRRSVPRDVLRGLGKRLSLPESPRQMTDLWPLVELWLGAEQVRELFVLRAHLLDEETLLRLLAACDAAFVTPWLIVAGPEPPAAMMALLDELPMALLDDSRPRARVRSFEQTATEEVIPAPRRPQHPKPWPPLPDDEFWSFRSTSSELLSDADFRRLDAELFVGRMVALEWIERRTRQPHWAARPLKATEIHGLLAGIYASTTSTSQALARLRGAQIALFLGGALVHIPADALAAAAAIKPAPLDRDTAVLLRAFTSPRLAAAGVLALASGQPARRLCALDLQSVGHDAGEISLDGRAYPIAFYARGMLRAQLIARAHEGAAASDPLFRSDRDHSQRISVGALQGILVRLSAATGLALNADAAHGASSAPRWPQEHHVSIELLETGQPG